jgi:hypothetical protein
MKPSGAGAEVLVQAAGGVEHVAHVLQREVAVGQPRGDDGLRHHADQQDALAGHGADQVEEPVEQVALNTSPVMCLVGGIHFSGASGSSSRASSACASSSRTTRERQG